MVWVSKIPDGSLRSPTGRTASICLEVAQPRVHGMRSQAGGSTEGSMMAVVQLPRNMHTLQAARRGKIVWAAVVLTEVQDHDHEALPTP